jgi:hypothetical protein
MSDRFDDIFDAVASKEPVVSKPGKSPSDSSPVKKSKKMVTEQKEVQPPTSQVDAFWSSLDNPDTIRLNVDIPLPLNDRLSAKAKTLKQSKSELVRRLLEWALDD